MTFKDLLVVLNENTKLYVSYKSDIDNEWRMVDHSVKWFNDLYNMDGWIIKSINLLSETSLSVRMEPR